MAIPWKFYTDSDFQTAVATFLAACTVYDNPPNGFEGLWYIGNEIVDGVVNAFAFVNEILSEEEINANFQNGCQYVTNRLVAEEIYKYDISLSTFISMFRINSAVDIIDSGEIVAKILSLVANDERIAEVLGTNCVTISRLISAFEEGDLSFLQNYANEEPIFELLAFKEKEERFMKDFAVYKTKIRNFNEPLSIYLGDKDLIPGISTFYVLEWVKSGLDLNPLPNSRVVKQLIIREQTKQVKRLAAYCFAACFGEMRHIQQKPAEYWPLLIKELSEYYSSDRESIWKFGFVVWDETNDLEKSQILDQLGWGFGNYEFPNSSYGGQNWARIAYLTSEYFSGEISGVEFFDRVVDIVHNCGWAFNKYYKDYHNCSEHMIHLTQILDWKANDGFDYILANSCLEEFDPRLKPLIEKEFSVQLLEMGKRFMPFDDRLFKLRNENEKEENEPELLTNLSESTPTVLEVSIG